jgi:hypothetical protein
MQHEKQKADQIAQQIDELAQTLLRMKKYKVQVIDLAELNASTTQLARAWLSCNYVTPVPKESEEAFARLVLNRVEEMYSPILWMAMTQVLRGALEYADRGVGATVMPQPYRETANKVSPPDSSSQDDEYNLFESYAERIRVQGVLQVALNWGEVESILDEYYGLFIPGFKTEEEAKRAWDSLSSKQKKHIKRRSGDAPAEKSIAINQRVERLTDEQREAMRRDLVKLSMQDFQLNIDHVIRCAVMASLFLGVLYWEYRFEREKGTEEKEAQRYLPGVEELRDIVASKLSDWLIKPLPKKIRGGDRKSGSKLSDEEIEKLRARKEELTPFWRSLLAELEKHDYDDDVWPWLRKRESSQQARQRYQVYDLAIVDELVIEALRRRPYFLKNKTDKMPASLSPAALAQQQAALELGIEGTYDAIKKKIQSKHTGKSIHVD